MKIRKNLKAIKILLASVCLVSGCILTSGIQFTKAAEPPVTVKFDDGGNSSSSTNAYYTFKYKLERISYDKIKGIAVYDLTQSFVIQNAGIPVYSDIVYLNGSEVGTFSSHNSSYVAPGSYDRTEKIRVTLKEGRNVIQIRGQYSGNDSGDAEYEINIGKFGSDPIVHGVNGTWTAGEISNGKRTWQSLYTDGATGSENGNKTPTSTGFFYSDADEHPSRVASYVDDVPLSKNASLREIEKQNTNGTWTSISLNWGEMDKVGVYRLRACTKDQANNEVCGKRIVTVQQKKYEVKYNGNGKTGGTMSNSTHTYDVSKNLTANAYSKTGYHFDHWNTKADNSGTSYANQQSVKNLSSTNGAVVNLYARWAPNTYSVVYNGNGKTGGTMSNSSHTYDQTKSLSTNQYTKTGYTFTAWNTKADGSGTGYVDKKEVKNLTSTNGAKVNLYARWKANTYSVVYNGNGKTGGTMSNSSHTYDQAKNLSTNQYTKTGYTFTAWNTKADGSGTGYVDKKEVKNLTSTNGAKVNLYARWKANTYSVVYNGNGKTGGTMSNSSHTYDQAKNLSTNRYTKTGYTFTAWNTKADGSGTGYVDEKEVKNLTSTNGAKVNLYARWKANTYSVVYNGNGKTGGTMSNSSHTYDQAKNLSTNQYTKTGYTFTSWNTKADGSGTTYTNEKEVKNLTSTQGAKINLYAQWTPNTYTVKYNGNHATSGTTADTTHTYDVSKQLRENDYLRDGWKYMGWNTKADGTGTAYANQQSVKNLTSTNGAVVNLYAQWNKAPSLITTNKVFYENEISEQTWLNNYRMKNIRAVDLEDGDISDDIRIIADYVDVTKPGNYQVYYEVTDSVDQKIQESSTVTIKYNNPPIIRAENQVYQLGSITQEQWTEELRNQLASANDVEDGDITDHIQITLDETNTALPGVYRVKYEVTDRFGKKGEKLITVEIRYNQAPQIEAENITIYEDVFTNAVLTERLKRHASAYDFEDGDLSSQVRIVANNVDTHTPGNYEVTYQVTDSQGAVGTKTIDVTVLENYQPILQLLVSNKRFIEGEYTQSEWEEQLRMEGVSAHDREDHDLTDQIQIISDNTNPLKRGNYEVVYTVSDRFGKSATKTAKVTVEPNEAPIIYANDKYFTTSDTITDKILLKNVYASDDHDTDINKHITVKSHNIVSGKAGVYEVTYEAVDSLGKKGSKKIQVHIIESTETPITPPLPEDEEALYLWNGHEHGLVNITKLMEHSDLGHDINALQDVVFGIYAKEDIIYQNQVVLKAGSLVAITQADEYGQLNAIIHHKGKYVLKELKTNDHYVLEEKEYKFEYQ